MDALLSAQSLDVGGSLSAENPILKKYVRLRTRYYRLRRLLIRYITNRDIVHWRNILTPPLKIVPVKYIFGTSIAKSNFSTDVIRKELIRDHSLLLPDMLDEVFYVIERLIPRSESRKSNVYMMILAYDPSVSL